MSEDLIDWLRAQIDDDERIAGDAGGAWHEADPDRDPGLIMDEAGEVVIYDEGRPNDWQAEHIARHDPARVLRDVRAYRLIIEQYEMATKRLDRLNQRAAAGTATEHEMSQRAIEGVRANESYKALRLVAAIFDDRPGYREEWRPQ